MDFLAAPNPYWIYSTNLIKKFSAFIAGFDK